MSQQSGKHVTVIGLANPFPIRIPLPVRHEGDVMEPRSISFDGSLLRIEYLPAPKVRMRWHAAAVHQHDYLPSVKGVDDVIAHYARELRLRKEARERLAAAARFVKCGRGLRTQLRQKMATGRNVAGGSDSIYVLSENGEAGALRFRSEFVQKYPLGKFRVGAEGDWTDLLEVGDEPTLFSHLVE